METKFKVLITFLVVVFLIAGLYFFTNWFSLITGYFAGESEQQKLAHCLFKQGAEFYGAEYCADCEKQKNLFRKSFDLINYIDCGRDKSLCPNIREIPAWFMPNSQEKIYYGFRTFNELKELSGCE